MKRDKGNRFTTSRMFFVNVDSIMDKTFSIFGTRVSLLSHHICKILEESLSLFFILIHTLIAID